ncbi:WD repeat protein [Grosmannia clavigera kw1407]|uniref:WD repeat protein n=1 Tax=Grosmannia clavigera (strain kw1407 / UAMH 11150) TaxID=655863 RepID=F0XAJ8_GROCL|nr:WD repeat protein [Grosmannia clavigera kw1407]EFX05391.1 WD repeat protein [Grosmannia clavigera kw1407]
MDRPPRLHRAAPPLCPVTALAFFQRRQPGIGEAEAAESVFLLAAEDGWLCVYGVYGDARSTTSLGRLHGRLPVFSEQAIQGCCVDEHDEGDVLVWGGRSAALVRREQIERLGEQRAQSTECVAATACLEARAPDWIYDGLLPRRAGGLGALVTAHNEVVPFRVDGQKGLVLGAAISPSRPGLYAAKLAWGEEEEDEHNNGLVVAAGTAFGEIIVWTCRLADSSSDNDNDNDIQVLDVFSGHEGSIFGVAMRPALGLLVSCSDDRTIRAWPLRLKQPGGRGGSRGRVLTEARETGFLTKTADDGDATTTQSPEALAVVMAHASRIWHVRFGPATSSRSSIGLFSFGEDATAQEWRLVLDTTASSSCFEHVRTLCGHAGKNIWAAAVLQPRGTSDQPPLVATGAADGKICLFAGVDSQELEQEQEQGHVPPSRPDGPPKTRRDEVFNNYAFLSGHHVLAATSHGRLFLGSIRMDAVAASTTTWAEVDVPPAAVVTLQKYNVVRAPRADAGPAVQGLALVGGAGGRLFMYSPTSSDSESGRLQPLDTAVAGKVEDMFFLPDEEEGNGGDDSTVRLQVVIAVLAHDALLLDLAVSAVDGRVLSERARPLRLPSGSDHVTTTAAGRCCGHVILGSRKGQLLLYRRGGDDDDYDETPSVETHTDTRDAILTVVPLPPQPGRPRASCSAFAATARDGTYRIYAIEEKEQHGDAAASALSFQLRHETSLPFGPIIRDAWFVDSSSSSSPELVLCGFRSSRFVVWNETRQQELAAVECAGTHRTYAYRLGGGGEVRLAFTRGGRLHVFAQTASPLATVRPGGHGREIKAVAASASGQYVATGGEDTVVRVWEGRRIGNQPDGHRNCLAVLKRHNTGLHGLAWLGDDCLVSAGGAEELFMWRVSRIADSAYDGLAVLCASAYPDRVGDDKTLRVTAVDASLEADGTLPANTKANMLITMALSNSVLKTYRYCPADDCWQLLARGRYTGACPTHVRHLRLRPRQALVVLAAFTDGHLSVWHADTASTSSQPASYTLLRTTQVHRCAVKSLDLWQPLVGPARLAAVVVTGGDDNALAVTPLDSDGTDYAFRTASRVSSAHAAAVTGLCILGGAQPSEAAVRLTVVSCSNDQRVKAWAVHVGPSVQVQLLDSQSSAVADAADMEMVDGQEADGASVMVVGMGMETCAHVTQPNAHQSTIMSFTATRALTRHAGAGLARCTAGRWPTLVLGAVAAAATPTASTASLPTSPLWQPTAVSRREFGHSIVRAKKASGGGKKGGKADKKDKASPTAEDDDGGNHPQADAADPFNFADVESRWQRSDAHHEDKFRELRRALGSGAADGSGAVDLDAIGATPVTMAASGSEGATTTTLSQLALVIPRAGGRFVELRMHSATSRKAITRAVQHSPQFRGQQPQPDPDDELVLLVRMGGVHEGATEAAAAAVERARRVSDLANGWRAQIRRATARRQKTHQTWRKDGSVRPDDLHRLDRDLLRGQDKHLAHIDTVEKEAVRLLERTGRR